MYTQLIWNFINCSRKWDKANTCEQVILSSPDFAYKRLRHEKKQKELTRIPLNWKQTTSATYSRVYTFGSICINVYKVTMFLRNNVSSLSPFRCVCVIILLFNPHPAISKFMTASVVAWSLRFDCLGIIYFVAFAPHQFIFIIVLPWLFFFRCFYISPNSSSHVTLIYHEM